ncbi:MAG: GGDEF domain-containing protein [Solirubrobacteraceae bacterium]
MTDVADRLRPGMPLLMLVFIVAGVSGTGIYGWIPLLPPAIAVALYLAIWLAKPTRRRRPEYAYAAAFLVAEAMLALAIILGHGSRGYTMTLLMMPVLLAAVVFPRRVVVALAGFAVLLVVGLTLGVDLQEVRAIPAVAYAPPLITISLAVTGLVIRDLDDASRRSAFVDELTGALNRAALTPRVAELTHQTTASGEPVAAVIADIDHFKEINDRYGHVKGDAVLREIARRLADSVSAFEPVYRLGGEEFLVLLPGHDVAAAREVAVRMWRAVRQADMEGVMVTMSFGVAASFPAEPLDFDAVFARADYALYEAKQGGRDLVRTAAEERERDVDGAAGPLLTAARQHRPALLRAIGQEGPPHRERPQPPSSVRLEDSVGSGRRWSGGGAAVTEELEREHVIDLNRRLATLFRVLAASSFVGIAGAIPQFGWHPLVAPVIGAIPYYLLSHQAHRFRRPSRALGTGWALFQTSIAIGFASAHGAPLFALALIVQMVPGRCAVLRTRAAAAGTIYTALLIAGVSLYLDPSRVLANPSIALFPIALVIEAGYVGSVVGGSAVRFRGAGILDDLTGLLNRTALGTRLLEIEAQTASIPHGVAIVLADLDHFKAINDQAGHGAGDTVLRVLAARIAGCLRTFDAAYRVGGEEFLVLLPDADLAQATQIAERVLETVREEPCEGLSLTVSVGVAATRPGERFAYHELFGRADAALYEAKRTGRDRICVDDGASDGGTFAQHLIEAA